MNLLISFSGGETSAYMTYCLWNDWMLDGIDRHCKYEQVKIVFANTGEENEQTLEFVKNCSEQWNWDVIWVEAVVHHGERKASTHKVVDYKTASRNGEPYEEVIKKYGIPNQTHPHCTRELKQNPIYSYMASIGWEPGTYEVAIGIRADEAGRKDKSAKEKGIIYPLCDDFPTTKRDVNTFWSKQPFRLWLTGYQGNCKWCWKKSDRKLLTIMDETRWKFDFPDRMEKQYGLVGPEFEKGTAPGYRRTFFRKNRSVQDLYKIHRLGFLHAEDDSLDIDDGCVEACEIEWGQHASTALDPSLDAQLVLDMGKEK